MQDDDDSNDINFEDINAKLEKNVISMTSLEESIKEHPSSLKMVDMNIYEKWLEQNK
jgi:lambda repressor-like predicted transcriptional regulator